MPSRSSHTKNVLHSGISALQTFEPNSPIGDDKSTSGSLRKNPSGLDLLGHMDCFVVSGSKVIEGLVPIWSSRLEHHPLLLCPTFPILPHCTHAWGLLIQRQ